VHGTSTSHAASPFESSPVEGHSPKSTLNPAAHWIPLSSQSTAPPVVPLSEGPAVAVSPPSLAELDEASPVSDAVSDAVELDVPEALVPDSVPFVPTEVESDPPLVLPHAQMRAATQTATKKLDASRATTIEFGLARG